jgi:protoporphyrinogen oxidase
LWASPDDALVAMARGELVRIGLAREEDVLDGCVVRQRKAYPIYDRGWEERVDLVRSELERRFPTLHLAGRNGMHRYNNQDHSMATAMLVVENVLAGGRIHDPWRVNQDALYQEAGTSGSERLLTGSRLTPAAVT